MTQTDRQTDKPASHWKSGIFDVDDNWAKLDTLPSFVKRLHRQKEVCPTTGNLHFQVHVECVRQCRLTQLCSWIKSTKWIPVWGKDHIQNSINYCSKKDTAIAGTHEVIQGEKYYQMNELLLEIAKYYHPINDFKYEYDWEIITARMLRKDPKWANKLCNPAIKKAWDWWHLVFVDKVSEYCEDTCGAYIIEGPADEAPDGDESVERSEAELECLIE